MAGLRRAQLLTPIPPAWDTQQPTTWQYPAACIETHFWASLVHAVCDMADPELATDAKCRSWLTWQEARSCIHYNVLLRVPVESADPIVALSAGT